MKPVDIQKLMNAKTKHIICKATGKSFTQDFEQLKMCVDCKLDCKSGEKIVKSVVNKVSPLRRTGMASEYDR